MHSFVPASGGRSRVRCRSCCLRLAFVIFWTVLATAQGTLADYQRAERFLPGNLVHSVSLADVSPHWIEKTSRFWYRRTGPKGVDFVVVDAEQNTVAPAFDHTRLAAALSNAAQRNYSATELPFSDFEFVDNGREIRFSNDSEEWICNLESYECRKGAPSTGDSDE